MTFEVTGYSKVVGSQPELFGAALQAASAEEAKERFTRKMMRRKGAESVTIATCRLMQPIELL